jgi:hypothetical protein
MLKRMKQRTILSAFLLAATTCAIAQEQGIWRPVSKTAQSITGEIVLGAERLTINFSGFAASQIRPLKPAEITALFDGADATVGTGHLYRLSIPGDKRFLHKNTLCGSDETQWMVTYVAGKQLEMAFFSNATPPLLTIDGMNNNPNLCGTFTYSR